MANTVVNLTESPLANAASATSTATLFVAGIADQGPSSPVLCQSLTDYTNAFGARSTTSAYLYDTLEHFYSVGGSQAYVQRVTDSTATKASLTLNDASSHPTVTVTALTAGLDGNGYQIEVASSTVYVLDSSGDELEEWPFTTQPEILAITSAYVSFTQATGTGNTTAVPAAIAATALSGGTNASDLTDSSYVTALANFTYNLGPGQVAIPGKTSSTIVNGVFAHAAANNRFAVCDQADAQTSASAVSAASALAIPSAYRKCGIIVQGSAYKAGLNGSPANRTVPGSALVIGQRTVAANQAPANPAPAGYNFPIPGILGFTTAFSNSTAGGVNWVQGDCDAMKGAGLCYFAQLYGVNCLDEYVTPANSGATPDLIYGQATAWAETMAFVAEAQQAGVGFEFAVLDGRGLTINALHSALQAIVQAHYAANALYGDTVSDAASIVTASPVNTAATAQAGQLNANVSLKLSPYADLITININVLALTQSVGSSS